MLQVNPINRLNCEEILKNQIVVKRMEILNNNTSSYNSGINSNYLLNTIKLPRNINDINQRLPKMTNYDCDK